MKKQLITILRYAFFLFVGGFLLYLAFKGIDFGKLIESLRNANYGWVALSLFFAWLGYFSRAVRWKLLIDPLGKPVSLMNTYHAVTIGYLANFAFPRLGEVTRCASLNKTDKVPIDKLLGTVIAERVFDLFMLGLFILFLVIFRIDFFGDFLQTKVMEPIFGKVHSAFALPMVVWISLIGLGVALFLLFLFYREAILNLRLFRKVTSFIRGITQGFFTVIHMKKRGWFIFHTLFIWFCYVVMTYLVCLAIPSTAHLGWVDGVFLLVVGALGMSAPVQDRKPFS